MIPKTEIYYASRKTSSAHVFITKGVGKIRINNIPLEMIEPESSREVILAPLEIIGEEIRDKVDISIRVRGGGFMGQAYASATAMSRALIGWTKSKKEPKETGDSFAANAKIKSLKTNPVITIGSVAIIN